MNYEINTDYETQSRYKKEILDKLQFIYKVITSGHDDKFNQRELSRCHNKLYLLQEQSLIHKDFLAKLFYEQDARRA